MAVADWKEALAERIVSLYDPVLDELARVKDRVESYEQEPIGETQVRIRTALSGRGARVAIKDRLLSGLRLQIASAD